MSEGTEVVDPQTMEIWLSRVQGRNAVQRKLVLNGYDAEWKQYKTAHPEVWSLLKKYALEASQGGRKIGVKFIVERMRWELVVVQGSDDHGNKWNNNWTSYAARDLVEALPSLNGLVEFRKVRGE